jgi:hypothetical protein
MGRKYLPTFGELVDRLSIVLLKQIFLPELRGAYKDEAGVIMHDINDALDGGHLTAVDIHAILMLMLANRWIWENESATRAQVDRGDFYAGDRLRGTHSVNGVRTKAKNILSERRGERVDQKVDCLAADLPKEFGDWDVFG